jgi:hypothetical protein
LPIPKFLTDGWLPAGHHSASWDEIESVFAGQPGSRRRFVYDQLVDWVRRVQGCGLSGLLILNGSFISTNPVPGDVDLIFVYDSQSEELLKSRPELRKLLDYMNCKNDGPGDVFCFPENTVRNFPKLCRLDGFDLDKQTGEPKGVIELLL